jgi:flagellar biosynthesis GTPase FlhF
MEAAAAAVAAAVLRDKLKEKYKQRKVSGRREGSSDKDIKFLNKELRSIRAAVSMLSDLPQDELDKPHKLYARQWRELSYDIEDFLDTLPHLRKGLVKKMAYPFHERDRTGRHIAGEIRALKARIMEEAEWLSMYKVHEWAAADGPGRGRVDPRVIDLYRPASDLVGIDEATEGDGASYLQLKIVSLVGLAGLGKTTLAKLLYDKIKSTFDCSAFVSLSWSPNMMRVFTDIFYDLGSEEYRRDIHGASWDQAKAIDKLKNFLQSKRYASCATVCKVDIQYYARFSHPHIM